MTREHKLAIVLGFGLLLFVGILISDHFSAGQRRPTADLAANTQIREVRPAAPISIQPIQVTGATAPQPAAKQRQFQQGGDTVALPEGIVPSPVQGADPVGLPVELYTLREGETLYKLCQAKYGNGNLWKELAEFNKATIPNPTKMRAGMTVRLPAVHVLRGEAAPAPSLQQVAVPLQQASMPQLAQPTPAASGREYVIQKGDTLGAIAARELGSAKKWEAIYQANRDRMKNPSDLRIGKSLRVPSDL
ncbi:MAG: LysM peptidoglycan-binding domain-containing protein [Planctomycetes bacterium]|nr:LysM peptidoglycan-binding domain-containing protein [Planctomycetota bacterium]